MSKREEIQKEALSYVIDKHRVGLGISMGVGKTYIGLQHMQNEYEKGKRKFLVAAPKKSIFKSWTDDAEKFKLNHLLDCINFTTYISLKKQDFDYDVIYLDECHSLLNSHDFYLSMFGGKILGLTGTPPRYKNTEKGKMVDKYCPIVYKYIADDAIEDEILNDYKIIVHELELSRKRDLKIPNKDKKSFFVSSEYSSYRYWTDKLSDFCSPKQLQIFKIMRMKAMMGYPSKEEYAKNLLEMIHEKTILFCNTIEQANNLCEHSYHSNNPDSEENLESFKKGNIDKLSCVLQLSEGITIPNLKQGIIMHAYGNEKKSSQRIGRLLRLNPKEKSIIHILMYKDTVDERWVSEALKDWDSSKIFHVEPLNV